MADSTLFTAAEPAGRRSILQTIDNYVYILGIMVALLFWAVTAAPTFSTVWWMSAITFTGIVLAIATRYSAKVKAIVESLEDIFSTGFMLGILYALVLTGVYASIYVFGASVAMPYIESMLPSWDPRLVLAVVAILVLGTVVAVFQAYSPVGIPMEISKLKRARNGLVLLVVVTLAIFNSHNEMRPQFFDANGGGAKFMMTPDGSSVDYSRSPADCAELPKGCYDTATNVRLVPLTPEVAERHGMVLPDLGLSNLITTEAEREASEMAGFFKDARYQGCSSRVEWRLSPTQPVRIGNSHNDTCGFIILRPTGTAAAITIRPYYFNGWESKSGLGRPISWTPEMTWGTFKVAFESLGEPAGYVVTATEVTRFWTDQSKRS